MLASGCRHLRALLSAQLGLYLTQPHYPLYTTGCAHRRSAPVPSKSRAGRLPSCLDRMGGPSSSTSNGPCSATNLAPSTPPPQQPQLLQNQPMQRVHGSKAGAHKGHALRAQPPAWAGADWNPRAAAQSVLTTGECAGAKRRPWGLVRWSGMK